MRSYPADSDHWETLTEARADDAADAAAYPAAAGERFTDDSTFDRLRRRDAEFRAEQLDAYIAKWQALPQRQQEPSCGYWPTGGAA